MYLIVVFRYIPAYAQRMMAESVVHVLTTTHYSRHVRDRKGTASVLCIDTSKTRVHVQLTR